MNVIDGVTTREVKLQAIGMILPAKRPGRPRKK
jgi:hypothetical protein